MSINSIVHSKIVAHSAKYPEAAVNGILIGRLDGDKAEVIDAIPVQHLWNKLSPVMEIALQLIEAHAISRDLSLVGIYEASEYVNEQPSLSSTAIHILNKIRSNSNNSKHVIGIAIDNNNVLKENKGDDLVTYKPSQSQSFSKVPLSIASVDTPKIKTLVDCFYDLDNHLGDNSLDWINNKSFVRKL